MPQESILQQLSLLRSLRSLALLQYSFINTKISQKSLPVHILYQLPNRPMFLTCVTSMFPIRLQKDGRQQAFQKLSPKLPHPVRK